MESADSTSSPVGLIEADALDRQAAVALLPALQAIRNHPWLVIASMVAALVACGLLLTQRTSSFEARAQILVTPLVEGDTAYVGLPILRTSPGDPTRTVQTAAALISSPEVANAAARHLEGANTSQVRAAVTTSPVEGANVIDIVALSDAPGLASEIASAYAVSVIETRRALLAPLVSQAIERTKGQIAAGLGVTGSTGSDLEEKLSQLSAIGDGTDPTLSVAQKAGTAAPLSQRPGWQILILACLSGLALGVGAAIFIDVVSPRRVDDSA